MIFGRRKRSQALEILAGSGWRCGTCGQLHQGIFDLAAAAPDYWEGPEEYEPNGALRLDGDFLSEDFCVAGGEHFFVRCVFEIPVRGLDHRFGFGVWSTLSRKNFESYVEHFDDALTRSKSRGADGSATISRVFPPTPSTRPAGSFRGSIASAR